MSAQQRRKRWLFILTGMIISLSNPLWARLQPAPAPISYDNPLPENNNETITGLNQRYAVWDTNRVDEETAQLYASLSGAYATAGNKQKAYLFFEHYSRIKDSLFRLAKEGEIQKLKKDVAAAGKDKELAQKNIQIAHNQELVSRKHAIVLGLAGGILLIVILCLQSVKTYLDKRNLLKKVREQTDHDMAISLLQASFQGEHRERDKIAIQLHHSIKPLLQEVQLQLEELKQSRHDIVQRSAFSETQKIVQDVQLELEDISSALASSDIGTLGLAEALHRFISNIPENNDLSVELIITGKQHPLPAEKEMVVYRILQELVQNIMKHARANRATIIIDYRKHELGITVKDNGRGFGELSDDKGMGWANIRDRLLYLQGTYTTDNKEGARVDIRIPLT